MSKAYKCDRCGLLYEVNDDTRIKFDGQHLKVLCAGDDSRYTYHSPFDICNKCATEFVNWWTKPTMEKEETI